MTLPAASEYVALFLDGVKSRLGVAVDRTEGSTWDKFAGGLASALRRSDLVAARSFDASFLDRCNGLEIDAYCAKRGPVTRLPASKARGKLTLTRATVTAGADTIEKGTEVRAPYKGSSYIFETVADASVSSTATSVIVEVIAQAEGRASNVGTVTAGLSLTGQPSELFDETLLPTSLVVAGGSNTESDDQLKKRQRLYEQARQRATEAAISYGALLVPGVKHVVCASYDDPNLGARSAVYIGDEDWQSSEVMLNDVARSIESWRAAGPSLPVRGMTSDDVNVSATLRMMRAIAKYNEPKLRAALEQRAVAYFDRRLDPFSYDVTMLASALAQVNDEVAGITLAAPLASMPSPFLPAAVEMYGFPDTLTRYRTQQHLTSFTIRGA